MTNAATISRSKAMAKIFGFCLRKKSYRNHESNVRCAMFMKFTRKCTKTIFKRTCTKGYMSLAYMSCYVMLYCIIFVII